jgi:glycogen debranching enzyme
MSHSPHSSPSPNRPPASPDRPKSHPPKRTSAPASQPVAATGAPASAPAGGATAAPLAIQYREPIGAQDIRNTIVIKEFGIFLITDPDGNVPRGNVNGLGLYYHDTRFLSAYELVLEGITPIYLLSSGRERFTQIQELTNPDLITETGQHIPRQVLRLQRRRLIGPDLWETLSIQNFHSEPLSFRLELGFGADFADMFAVRGLVNEHSGTVSPPVWGDDCLVYASEGIDGTRRTTRVTFDPAPAIRGNETAIYHITAPARGMADLLHVRIQVDPGPSGTEPTANLETLATERISHYDQWVAQQVVLKSDNADWDEALHRARFDLRVLQNRLDDLSYPAAGVPWYVALFGRDSLITALQFGWFPRLAEHVLRLHARHQGTKVDDWRDEQPGKILHELRQGPLAQAHAIPFTPYYGTVDATLWFIILLEEHYRVTGDVELLRELAPVLARALTWMEDYGDLDGDGFIEYQRRSPQGLINQGWKDSWDAIMYADGKLIEPPVALVEVQGYAYRARRAAAAIYRALGQDELAAKYDYQADWLQNHFEDKFWMAAEEGYCLALDGQKRQAKVISSNAGQALWSGIVSPARAKLVAARLMEPDMFTGWGIRTLSSKEVLYDPMGYHVGSVWPHDNALIAAGFKRYGEDEKFLAIVDAMFDLVQNLPDRRLRELICGFARLDGEDPVQYPVACSPQAWATGVLEYLLQLLLGLRPDAPNGVLRIIRPRLPSWLGAMQVTGIPVGSGAVDLTCRQSGNHTFTEIGNLRGPVQVLFSQNWGD